MDLVPIVKKMRSLSKKARSENIPETICLDFDGVCAKYNGENITEVGGPLDGLKDFIDWAKKEKYLLIVHSARNDEQIRQWCRDNNLDLKVSFGKPAATWYVDDRGVYFTGDFEQLKKDIKKTHPWWQKKKD